MKNFTQNLRCNESECPTAAYHNKWSTKCTAACAFSVYLLCYISYTQTQTSMTVTGKCCKWSRVLSVIIDMRRPHWIDTSLVSRNGLAGLPDDEKYIIRNMHFCWFTSEKNVSCDLADQLSSHTSIISGLPRSKTLRSLVLSQWHRVSHIYNHWATKK